ncbi:DMT family transporter [Opitutales bacterium ASA1]|uniref:DMT family transporter n=1 Tax=Congregicoccus parvus TaxID=3081749 RepID=UPI002B2C03FF|nr:DMT family transporter [Opitutales bacterium ASA1]
MSSHAPMPALADTDAGRSRAILLLLLSALLWSMGGLLIKGVEWSAPGIAATRSIVAALTIVAFYRGRLRFTWSTWQLAGAAAYAATVLLFVLATKLTTAANAILLQYTAPIYIALAAPWFLGEPSRRRDWWIIAVTLAGMSLFFVEQLSAEGLAGNLVAIASGIAFAALTLFLRKQKDGSAVESIVLGNILAAVIALPFVRGPFPEAAGWGMLLVLGVVQLGLSYIVYAAAIRRATAMDAALVPMLEPILNPVWVLLFLGERPGPWALAGGAVVIGAVAVRAALGARERPPPAPPRRGAFPSATT